MRAGFGMGQLGQEALSTSLTGANQLMGVGGMQQRLAQSIRPIGTAGALSQAAVGRLLLYPCNFAAFSARLWLRCRVISARSGLRAATGIVRAPFGWSPRC